MNSITTQFLFYRGGGGDRREDGSWHELYFRRSVVPQGLEPAIFLAIFDTAEAMFFQKRSELQSALEHFSNTRAEFDCVQGVFFLRKKTLGILLSLYSNGKNALALKRLIEIAAEILGSFEAYGDAEDAVACVGAEAFERLAGEVEGAFHDGVGGDVPEEAALFAERNRIGKDAEFFVELLGKRTAGGFGLEGQHAGEVLHLAEGQRVLRMRGEAGVDDARDGRVRLQKTRNVQSGFFVSLHAQLQRVQAATNEPCVEGTERAAEVNQRTLTELGQRRATADDGATERVAVAVEIFRQRVDNVVGTECERAGGDGRGHGGIDDELGTGRMRDVGGGGDVGEAQDGIGGRFGPEQARVFAHGRGDRFKVRKIDGGDLDAEAGQGVPRQLGQARVADVAEHKMIARAQSAEQKARDGAHAGGETERVLAAFKAGEFFFERVHGGRGPAGVEIGRIGGEILGRKADRGRVGDKVGGENQRGLDGAMDWIGGLADVQGAGAEGIFLYFFFLRHGAILLVRQGYAGAEKRGAQGETRRKKLREGRSNRAPLRLNRQVMRRILLPLAVLCVPVCTMAQAPATATPAEALADAMAPFLATRQQPDDLTEADQRALALGRARAAEACVPMDAQTLEGRIPLELARLCLFGQRYEPARQAALRALHTVPETEQWEAHQLLAEAFLGLDNPVNAAIQLLAVEASGHFDPAAYRLMVRALDAGGVLQDRSMNELCHVQLTHALALLEQGKVLEDANDTIAPDQMMRDAYFSLSLLQVRHEATEATVEARLQKAAQLPALRALVGGRAMELPGARFAAAGKPVTVDRLQGTSLLVGKAPASRTIALTQDSWLLVSGALWLPGTEGRIAQLAQKVGNGPLLLVTSWEMQSATSHAEAMQQLRAFQKKVHQPILVVDAAQLGALFADVAPSALVVRQGKIEAAGELRNASAAEIFRRALTPPKL